MRRNSMTELLILIRLPKQPRSGIKRIMRRLAEKTVAMNFDLNSAIWKQSGFSNAYLEGFSQNHLFFYWQLICTNFVQDWKFVRSFSFKIDETWTIANFIATVWVRVPYEDFLIKGWYNCQLIGFQCLVFSSWSFKRLLPKCFFYWPQKWTIMEHEFLL